MIIGMPIYNDVDLLDVAGPREMFNWMKSKDHPVDLVVAAEKVGTVVTRDGLGIQAPVAFADAPQFDVLWIPGGDVVALRWLMQNEPGRPYLHFLAKQAAKAKIVASVCEGALLAAAAGLLDGYSATTHWAFVGCLKKFPKVNVVDGLPRYVFDRNRLTGGGISSGLDESLALIERLAGTEVARTVQQNTQYYPRPPVDSPSYSLR